MLTVLFGAVFAIALLWRLALMLAHSVVALLLLGLCALAAISYINGLDAKRASVAPAKCIGESYACKVQATSTVAHDLDEKPYD